MLANYYRLYRADIHATIKLGTPIVIGQLGIILMGVIDVVMIRPLGVTATAAAGASNNLFFLITMLSLGACTVISPMVAKAKQENNLPECQSLFRTGILMSFVLAIFTFIALFILKENLHRFGQKPDVIEASQGFLLMITFSVIPMLLFMAMKQFTDGLSLTRIAMTITWIGLVSNVFLNWIFIHGKLGMPQMGLTGSGFATLLARLIMAGLLFGYIFKNRNTNIYLYGFFAKKHIIWAKLKKMLALGLPTGSSYFFEAAAFSVAGLMTGIIDKYSLAAHHVAITLASVTYMVTTGIAGAGAIRVGQAMGEKNMAKVRKAGTATLILGIALMGVFCVMFLTTKNWLVLPFLEDANALPIAVSLIVIAGFFQLSDGVQAVALGILRGISDVQFPTMVTLLAYWGVAIPLGYFLAFKMNLDALGIWIGLCVGLTISAVWLTIRFYKKTSRMR